MDFKVSLFDCVKRSKTPLKTVNFYETLKKKPTPKELDLVKRARKGDKDAKKLLPCVTVSAVFNGRRNLDHVISATGRICMDLDGYTNWKKVLRLPYVEAVTRSVGGEGLAVIIRVPKILDNEQHTEYYRAIADDMMENIPDLRSVDKTSDIARLRILSFNKVKTKRSVTTFRLRKEESPMDYAERMVDHLKRVPFKDYHEWVIHGGFPLASLVHKEPDYAERASALFVHLTRMWEEESGEKSKEDPAKKFESLVESYSPKRGKTMKSFFRYMTENNCLPSGFRTRGDVLAKRKKKKSKRLGFTYTTASQVLERGRMAPPLVHLFGSLVRTGELTLLFADTNVGKSILAAQLANSISSGTTILGLSNDGGPMKVMYIDFELNDRQWVDRSGDPGMYNSNFLLQTMDEPIEFTEMLENIELAFNDGVDYVIIDNMSFLTSNQEEADTAISFMNKLRRTIKNTDKGILLINHTKKKELNYGRPNPIELTDSYGSSKIGASADSTIGMGVSYMNPSIKYLKHLKTRGSGLVLDRNNVMLLRIDDESGISFKYAGYTNEDELTMPPSKTDRKKIKEKLAGLDYDNIDYAELESEFGIAKPVLEQLIKDTKKHVLPIKKKKKRKK
jgi:KaiC/GvpD/RAD55 family RecA-like ATPase